MGDPGKYTQCRTEGGRHQSGKQSNFGRNAAAKLGKQADD
jgi:hypothetical protein